MALRLRRATTPSEQAEQIAAAVRPNTVIVSQSLGALGVVEALREPVVKALVSGVVIVAPPARRPFTDVLLHPALLERLNVESPESNFFGCDVTIRTYSHPEGVALTEAYQDEVAKHNDSFDDELRELAGLGIAKVVRPSRDWNQNYSIATYPGAIEIIGSHSFAGGEPEELLSASQEVYGVVRNIISTADLEHIE